MVCVLISEQYTIIPHRLETSGLASSRGQIGNVILDIRRFSSFHYIVVLIPVQPGFAQLVAMVLFPVSVQVLPL